MPVLHDHPRQSAIEQKAQEPALWVYESSLRIERHGPCSRYRLVKLPETVDAYANEEDRKSAFGGSGHTLVDDVGYSRMITQVQQNEVAACFKTE